MEKMLEVEKKRVTSWSFIQFWEYGTKISYFYVFETKGFRDCGKGNSLLR